MAIFLLNTPVITTYGTYVFQGPVEIGDATTRLLPGFCSAIGHEGSAMFLSRLLGLDIPMNRIAITMQPGDEALVLRIKTRLPEGEVLSEEAFNRIPYELGWLTRTA